MSPRPNPRGLASRRSPDDAGDLLAQRPSHYQSTPALVHARSAVPASGALPVRAGGAVDPVGAEPTEPETPSHRRGRRAGAKGLTQQALGGMMWTFSGTGVQGLVQLLVLMAL